MTAVLSVIAVFTVVGTIPVITAWKKNMEEVGNPFVFFDAIKLNYLTNRITQNSLKEGITELQSEQNNAKETTHITPDPKSYP